ncbi:hypothetical protein JIX56_01955 [Streptomyces sp. CA-210063]|uniref:hypothetical protein n=1 Tax=Streptomyces sp. CA-210063 TaxID=2801029 RepID=UPI00214BF2C4|nr:hypothetical protein [Streptomyces sp. CA-210063]UUU28755.1 hypothetical protein JIX56_01955 [Streptomyces sp. CA-210063]
MINSAVRHTVVAALTTALALLPTTAAQAEESDKDNNIEKVELFGVSVDTAPEHIAAGDRWVTHQKLYTVKKTKGKRTVQYAGKGESECGAVQVSHGEVTSQCTRVLRLKKGTLTLSDMITYRPPKPVTAKTAIIGGTGHYRSAYGEGYITLDGPRTHLELDVDE